MKELEDKYVELLLKRCLNFEKSKSLFISYDVVNKDFVEKVIAKAKEMGVVDIGIDEEDINITHDKLKKLSLEEIENDPYFNKSKWDDYATKNASFLMLETEFPHLMDDIDPDKISKAKYINRTTRNIFREKEKTYAIPWCIAALPNAVWAKEIFKSDNSYDKLYKVIFDICMIDDNDPIENWNNYGEESKKLSDKLNKLEIKQLHYKNSLGTDLIIEMPDHCLWKSVGDDGDGKMIVNMPSYEIFSSPNYLKTNGIVYNSRPLSYGGGLIDEFFIEFKDGKVVNYDAKTGKEILKGIIENDNNSCYLGEVALVNNDSPISNTGLIFGITLIDENASCHLALGDGFPDTIEGGLKMSKEELLKNGINQSKQHVDFMIGTPDLEIFALTNEGEKYIFKKGNFII